MRFILAVCLVVVMENAYATSIRCDKDEKFQVHSSKVQVEYIWDTETWLVLIKTPEIIGAEKFSRALAIKGDDGEVFTFPLESTTKEGVVESHFYGNESTLSGIRLVVWYGAPCPKIIELPLKHNKRL